MAASDASGPQGRILLVDDDQALGGYLCRVLRAGGERVLDPADISNVGRDRSASRA